MGKDLASERRMLAKYIEQRCLSLGILAVCPYLLDSGNQPIVEFSGYLPEFGSPRGLLIDVVVDPDYIPSESHKQAADSVGIPVSFINRTSWACKADEFVAALRDWGYFGQPENKPAVLRKRE